MTDKRNGFIAAIIKTVLSFIALFYGLAVKMIRAAKTFTSKRLPCRVISIGNITLGGTGKTPTASFLAKWAKNEGFNVSVLIRGYGNDEWRMLGALLGDIPLIVGRDRISSGNKAIVDHDVDALILDDGFQHWRLKRDLDIVLLDATNPFGNRRFFPRGILREGIKALKRADIIMLTKVDMSTQKLNEIKKELRFILPSMPLIESVHNPAGLYDLIGKRPVELSQILYSNVCALSSVVNAEYFEFMLRKLDVNINLRFHYPDHYNYKKSDLGTIITTCKKRNIKTIITTEKDAVKLQDLQVAIEGVQILVLRIELKVTNGEKILRERLHNLYISKSS